MTKQHWDACTVTEKSIIIALKVMRWRWLKIDDYIVENAEGIYLVNGVELYSTVHKYRKWNPIEDWNDLQEVITAMNARRLDNFIGQPMLHHVSQCSMGGHGTGRWTAQLCHDFGYGRMMRATTMPEAICLAILDAVEPFEDL